MGLKIRNHEMGLLKILLKREIRWVKGCCKTNDWRQSETLGEKRKKKREQVSIAMPKTHSTPSCNGKYLPLIDIINLKI